MTTHRKGRAIDWWRRIPFYSCLPKPLFRIRINDSCEVPVIELPVKQFLSPALHDKKIKLYAVLGFLTPTGNIKYIPAWYMVEKAIERGLLKPGDQLVESSSGNMAVSLAFCGEERGIRFTAIVSDKLIRRKLLPIHYNGGVVLKEKEAAKILGFKTSPGATTLCEAWAKQFGAVFLNQYKNTDNPESYTTLVVPELWKHLAGKIKVLACAVGSGGAVLGMGQGLKAKDPTIKVVATFPYIGEEIGGSRDLERQKNTQDSGSVVDVQDPTSEQTAMAYSKKLEAEDIPGGETAGAAVAATNHFLCNELTEGRLESLRSPDGTIGVVILLADTIAPYKGRK